MNFILSYKRTDGQIRYIINCQFGGTKFYGNPSIDSAKRFNLKDARINYKYIRSINGKDRNLRIEYIK